MKIAIINGPNLNRLGHRNPDIYGHETWDDTLAGLKDRYPDIEIMYYQSNCEGALIDYLQSLHGMEGLAGIVINPGAYAHYSLALADALADCPVPAVEVHISNITAREDFRRTSVTAPSCRAIIAGAGREGYSLAIQFLTHVDAAR